MGKFYKGILGGFSGTVGTVVGATWRGLDIMRSRPKKVSRIPTQKQAEQRERFALVAQFLRPIRVILRAYFGQPSGEKSRSNLATAYHLTDALQGVYPALAIDFTKVIISKGELLGLQDPSVTPVATAKLTIDWTDNSGQGQAKTDDGLFVAVYNETNQQWAYVLSAAARTSATHALTVPDHWVGHTVHVYLGVASADEKLYGNSVYFGPLVVL